MKPATSPPRFTVAVQSGQAGTWRTFAAGREVGEAEAIAANMLRLGSAVAIVPEVLATARAAAVHGSAFPVGPGAPAIFVKKGSTR